MDRVDMPITKHLPYFWSFLYFGKHFMMNGDQVKIYNISWNSENKEAKRGWACSKRKKNI